MTDKKHPPRRESGTPPRRGIVEFIPPLRGDSFDYIFRIDLHASYVASDDNGNKDSTNHGMSLPSSKNGHTPLRPYNYCFSIGI